MSSGEAAFGILKLLHVQLIWNVLGKSCTPLIHRILLLRRSIFRHTEWPAVWEKGWQEQNTTRKVPYLRPSPKWWHLQHHSSALFNNLICDVSHRRECSLSCQSHIKTKQWQEDPLVCSGGSVVTPWLRLLATLSWVLESGSKHLHQVAHKIPRDLFQGGRGSDILFWPL